MRSDDHMNIESSHVVSRQVRWHCCQVHHLAQLVDKHHNLGVALLGRWQLCGASITGAGAVLLQEGRPIAYESRKLSSAELNYTIGEQQLLAVVYAMRAWRCYREGVEFMMVTAHCPLTYLQTQSSLSRLQTRWSEYLQAFRF